jgi:hypothetical protein
VALILQCLFRSSLTPSLSRSIAPSPHRSIDPSFLPFSRRLFYLS